MFNLEQAWKDISKDDPDAAALLRSLYWFFQKEDDFIDRDSPVSPEESAAVNLRLIEVIGGSAFYQRHRAFLWPLFVSSALAHVASEDFKTRPDVVDKIASQVLKSGYVDIFLGIAYCVGGWSHALAMQKLYRDYHYDQV